MLKVLAIDDSATIRTLLKVALESYNFEVALAENGQVGLDTLSSFSPDVIITDINMPVMDGFQFIETLREHEKFGALPIIVLSTESSPEMKKRARDIGATGWIVKPFEKSLLVNAINRVAG